MWGERRPEGAAPMAGPEPRCRAAGSEHPITWVQRLSGTLRVLAVVLWMVAIVPGLALRYRLIPDPDHGRC